MLLSKRNGEISHDKLTFNGWERGYSIELPTDEQVAKFMDEEGDKILHIDSDEEEESDTDPATEDDRENSPRGRVRSGSSAAEDDGDDSEDEASASSSGKSRADADTSLKDTDRLETSELAADLSPPALCRNLTL